MNYSIEDALRDLDRMALKDGPPDGATEYARWRESNTANQSRLEADVQRRWADEQLRAAMTLRANRGGPTRTVAYDESLQAQAAQEAEDAWEAMRPWNVGRAKPVDTPTNAGPQLAARARRGRTIDLSSPDTQGLERILEADRLAHPEAYPPDKSVRGLDRARSAATEELIQAVGDLDPSMRGASWRPREVKQTLQLVDPDDRFTPSDPTPHMTMQQAAELDPGFLETARRQFPELYLKTGE